LAILVADIFRQLYLNPENLFVAILRVDNVVLRQANIVRGNIAGVAVHLDEVSRAQRRRCQKIVKWTGRRAVALVADRLVRDDAKVVKLCLEPEVVEIVDLDFHGQCTGADMGAGAGRTMAAMVS